MTSRQVIRNALVRANAANAIGKRVCRRCLRNQPHNRFIFLATGKYSTVCDHCWEALGVATIDCMRCFKPKRQERFTLSDGSISPHCDACRAAIHARQAKPAVAAVKPAVVVKAPPAMRECVECGVEQPKSVFIVRNERRSKKCPGCEQKPKPKAVPYEPQPGSKRFIAREQAAERAEARRVKREAERAAFLARPVPVQRMSAEDLALFDRPIRIDRLPRRFGSWPTLVAQAEVDGLLMSPGKSVEWVLTDKGREMAGRLT